MRSMFKKTFVVTAMLSIGLSAFASEKVTLIVTKKNGAFLTAAANGEPIRIQNTISSSLFVSESEVTAKITELYQERNVIAVERDIIVHQLGNKGPENPYSIFQQDEGAQNAPNDPAFIHQEFFHERSERLPAGSNILAAWALGEQKIRPKIAVMDGGFLEEGRFEDAKPLYNYSFMNTAKSSVGDHAWNETKELDCEDGHGIGVYSIVGAISNNEKGVAGIVDADMYMLQVMECGSGSMFSASQSLRWAAGGEVEGVETLAEPVDVATFSLGARASCPTYMQEAIDFAVLRGVTVFMAAGNDNNTTTGFTPANCQNVIVTTALDAVTGDKASFGNYDSKVDIVTQGTSVGALGNLEGGIGLWSGTSFAGPISAGIYGLATAHAPSVPDDTLRKLMDSTLYPLENAPACDEFGCGKGLVNAGAFVEAAIKYEEGSFATVTSALAETALCDETPYLMASGLKARLCSAYNVSIEAGMFTAAEDDIVIYRLYQWPVGTKLNTAAASPLFVGIETTFMVNDIDVTQQAGLVRCLNGICDESLILPVSLEATGTPTACID